ncbi:MAG: iron ABC transporter permease [bacterium]|nr:iron ABC transporter permease [bacterium]MDZ4347372.1 iron ABC transporter permease [Candidatus Binatia bacterium]
MKTETRQDVFPGAWEGIRRLKQQGTALFAGGLGLFLLVLIGVPVVMVILMSLRTGFPGEDVPLTLENFVEVYFDHGTYEILLNTLIFAVSTIAVTLVFTVPLVWILMRTDIPLKKTIYVLLTIGILIPVFLRTIAWIILLSPRIGLLNIWLQELFALTSPPFNLYSITGMAFVQGVSFVPGAFFMLAAAYRAMDPSLEEAAYTSGAGKLRTFLKINIPITLPAIAAVMVYLFMTAIAVFEVPAIIGMPSRILVLSSLIYSATSPATGIPNYGIAGAYGAIMLVLGLALAFLYVRLVKQGKKYTVITGRGYRPRELALGGWKWAAIAFVFFYLSIEVFIPFAVLVWASILPYLQLPSAAAWSSMTLKHYYEIPLHVGALPFINTAILMFAVPTLTMIVSILVSWVVIRTQVPFRGTMDTLAFVPHAVPGILMAVGLAYLGLAYRDIFPLYGTVIIIIIAHTINWIAYGTRTTNSVMIQVHRELEEAGRVSGASAPKVLWKIVLPLIAAGVLNSWIWIGMLSYREVTMALTLYTRHNVVVSTVIWQFWGSGWIPQVSALGVILILFATIVVGTVRVVLSRVGEIGAAS